MTEKRNPLDQQDSPHKEGQQQNTPARTRAQPGKKENPMGSKKASSSPKKREGRKEDRSE